MRPWLRVGLVNVGVLSALLLVPAISFSFYKSIKLSRQQQQQPHHNLNINPAYPTEADRELAREMSLDKGSGTEYISFLGWKNNPFVGKHTNVQPPYNTRLSFGQNIDSSHWFFGGSTMFGTGASDFETIPSYYSKITGIPVFNFGQSGWVSRQSLNQLLNLLAEGEKPDSVIFYSGVNDVLVGCRSEYNQLPVHQQQQRISSSLKINASSVIAARLKKAKDFLIAPYVAILGKFGVKSEPAEVFGGMVCSEEPERAQKVADHLVANWYAAYLLSKSVGADFTAILQPVVFQSAEIKTDYLGQEHNYLQAEYDVTYPLILQEADRYCAINSDFCGSVIDATGWLDKSEPVYIDFCHITGRGNKTVASELADLQRGL